MQYLAWEEIGGWFWKPVIGGLVGFAFVGLMLWMITHKGGGEN